MVLTALFNRIRYLLDTMCAHAWKLIIYRIYTNSRRVFTMIFQNNDTEYYLGTSLSGVSIILASSPAAVTLACTTNGGTPTFNSLKKGT